MTENTSGWFGEFFGTDVRSGSVSSFKQIFFGCVWSSLKAISDCRNDERFKNVGANTSPFHDHFVPFAFRLQKQKKTIKFGNSKLASFGNWSFPINWYEKSFLSTDLGKSQLIMLSKEIYLFSCRQFGF